MSARLASDFESDGAVAKYYNQRYRLFKRFDEGVWITPSGWYSVTMEDIADHSARNCARLCSRRSVAVDLFAGCGGNTVQLAQHFERVIAVDADPEALVALMHNAQVYGVANKVESVQSDVFAMDWDAIGPVDMIHCSPPWGGELYIARPYFDVEEDLKQICGYPLSILFDVCFRQTPNVVVFLPRNVLVDDLCKASRCRVRLESHFCNDRCKAVSVYTGCLVGN